MPPLVEITKLSRKFGRTVAVSPFDLVVEEGTVLGLIGPNGAGKTTTLKILATLLRPTSGDALVGGCSVREHPDKVRRLIGYMPDVCGLYDDMLVHEYLRFFAAVYGIKGRPAEERVDAVLALTGMEGHVNDSCGALSRGLTQRTHLARVLLHDPKLLLLDEPASGLDPRARIEFRDLVLTLRRMGKTLMVSSHILSELGEMCDAIAIIEKSRLVYSGPVADATRSVSTGGRVVRVKAVEEPEAGRSRGDLEILLKGLPFVDAVRDGERDGHFLVRLKPGFDDAFVLNQELVQRGWKVGHFAEDEVRLEDAFLHLTKNAAP